MSGPSLPPLHEQSCTLLWCDRTSPDRPAQLATRRDHRLLTSTLLLQVVKAACKLLCALAARSEATVNLMAVYALRHLTKLQEFGEQGPDHLSDSDDVKLASKCACLAGRRLCHPGWLQAERLPQACCDKQGACKVTVLRPSPYDSPADLTGCWLCNSAHAAGGSSSWRICCSLAWT